MTRETDENHNPEDTAILQALRAMDAVDSERLRDVVRTGDETGNVLLRRYTEVLGLLGYAAEPQPAPEALKSRILTALAGDETQRIDPKTIPMASAPSRVESRTEPAPPVPGRRAVRTARRPSWLAAVLALVALGLLAGLLWFSHELEAHRERLAAQEVLLAELDEILQETRSEQASAVDANRAALAEIRDRFRLVTAAGTEICPMLPPERSPQPDARGVLYVAADHQHWYLKAEGLEPLEASRVYQLWFVAGPEGEPVSGGTFRPAESGEIQLDSPTMPEGTTAALVTLEPPEGRDRPSGPVVLYGDEVMRIL